MRTQAQMDADRKAKGDLIAAINQLDQYQFLPVCGEALITKYGPEQAGMIADRLSRLAWEAARDKQLRGQPIDVERGL